MEKKRQLIIKHENQRLQSRLWPYSETDMAENFGFRVNCFIFYIKLKCHFNYFVLQFDIQCAEHKTNVYSVYYYHMFGIQLILYHCTITKPQ